MNIAMIVPGMAQGYCGNCLRDAALLSAFGKLGHEITAVPLYLPFRTDMQGSNSGPIFFGGINVFLQQKSALFRKTPDWLDRLFDNPKILRWISARFQMVNVRLLGSTTVSILKGRDGRQAKEIDRLVRWLTAAGNKPDVVCLSNALLAGLAGPSRDALKVPIVCMLQDEDTFLDGLMSPYSRQAWELLKHQAKQIDEFVAASRYFAGLMQQRLCIRQDKIHVVYAGIPINRYVPAGQRPEVPVIGFLSRMCPEKGLDILVQVFISMKRQGKFKNVKLCLAGGKQKEDEVFLKGLERQLVNSGLRDDVEMIFELDHAAKLAFLQKLNIMCVPEKQPPAWAMYALESLSMAVPVVAPDHGALSELIEHTQDGLLYKPFTAAELARSLETLLSDPVLTTTLGQKGREKVAARFNVEKTAQETISVFRSAAQNFRGTMHA